MSKSDIDSVVRLVEDAIDSSEKAAKAIKHRDLALDRLKTKIGGDRLDAIRRGQQRIGELMTRGKA